MLVLAAAILLAVFVSLLMLIRRPAAPGGSAAPPSATSSQDEKAYASALSTADPRMSAAQNFLGQEVTYLDAKLSNNGTRTMRSVEIQMEFHDSLGQVVLRETSHPVNRRVPPLKPGETRAFRVAFEHMPLDWNQAPPSITIKSLSF